MANREEVVFRLAWVKEAGNLAIVRGVEVGFGASGEHLVRVALMRDVEDDLVTRGVEHAMQRDGELDDAKIGGQMAANVGCAGKEGVAHLVAKPGKLCGIERLNVLWR